MNEGGQQTVSRQGSSAQKSLPMAGFLSLPICVSRFAANMGVSRETSLLTKFNKQQKLNTISSVGQYLLQRPHAALDIF